MKHVTFLFLLLASLTGLAQTLVTPAFTVGAVASNSVSVTLGTSTGATKYQVQYSLTADFSAPGSYTTTSPGNKVIGGLFAISDYRLRARALSADGTTDSPFSGTVAIQTLVATPVLNVNEIRHNSISFTWSANSSIETYILEEGTDGTFASVTPLYSTTLTSASALSFTATGYSARQLKFFRLRGVRPPFVEGPATNYSGTTAYRPASFSMVTTPQAEVGLSAPVVASPVEIPMDWNRAAQHYNKNKTVKGRLTRFNDGKYDRAIYPADSVNVDPPFGNAIFPATIDYYFQPGFNAVVTGLWYFGTSETAQIPMVIQGIRADGSRFDIHTRTNFGNVGITYTLPSPVRLAGISFTNQPGVTQGYTLPTEFKLYGAYNASAPVITANDYQRFPVKFENMLGVNTHEWDFQLGNAQTLRSSRYDLFKQAFTMARLYNEEVRSRPWKDTVEVEHMHQGGWNIDLIAKGAKDDGWELVIDDKGIGAYLYSKLPPSDRSYEHTPLEFGSDRANPFSYDYKAQSMFQMAARYGWNPNVPLNLLLSYDVVHNGGIKHTKESGLSAKGLANIHYIEEDNERDKWWKGRKAYQTGREYAAELSASYDGHLNRMGPGRGMKNADPTLKLVMGGIAGFYKDYIMGMMDWSLQYRGRNADGTINVPWDVLNFHIYSNNSGGDQYSQATGQRGQCSDVSNAADLVNDVKKYLAEQVYLGNIQLARTEMWITELGYDKNQNSVLRAEPIGAKTYLQVIADWTLRDCLHYARLGVTQLALYQYQNADRTLKSTTQYTTMGLVEINDDSAGVNLNKHYPAANFLVQSRGILGGYHYKENLSIKPAVDVWENDLGQKVYAIWLPTETNASSMVTLTLPGVTSVTRYDPQYFSTTSATQTVSVSSSTLMLTATERPLFIKPN